MGYWPRKILLATDGSEDATQAALDVSNKSGAELYIVHARQREISEAHALSMPSTSYGWRERQAGKLLDEQVELMEEAGGVVAGSYLVGGEAPEEIAGLVERLDTDLLVVGKREQGPVRRLAKRSVSEEISRLVRCPVLVAKGGKGTWPPARIVVGEDFSEGSGGVARLAATLGGLYGARTLLVHAYPLLDLGQKAPILGVFRVNGEVRVARARLEELAEEIERELGTEALEARVAVGEPAGAIVEAAEEPGPPLVVVGSRGLRMLERIRDGSVSSRVVRGVDAPVLVCPRREG